MHSLMMKEDLQYRNQLNERSNTVFLTICLYTLVAVLAYLIGREVSIRWNDIVPHHITHDISHYKEDVYNFIVANLGYTITSMVINN